MRCEITRVSRLRANKSCHPILSFGLPKSHFSHLTWAEIVYGLTDAKMPKLKQLVCSIELSNSVTPCKEYGTVYEDGIVKTYIAIPRLDTFFAIRLTSEDYIDEGLAMFVYADGVYQCNRNQIGLIPSDGSTPVNLTEIDFRVRQKESHKAEDEWLGRQWRFKPAKLGKSDFIRVCLSSRA